MKIQVVTLYLGDTSSGGSDGEKVGGAKQGKYEEMLCDVLLGWLPFCIKPHRYIAGSCIWKTEFLQKDYKNILE